MLSIRENFNECIKGGSPDRFVNQYEFISLIAGGNPYSNTFPAAVQGGGPAVNGWGVTTIFPSHTPGAFPIHDDEHKVLKDITKWRDIVKAPSLDYPKEEWEKYSVNAEAIDRSQVYAAPTVAPGIFEQLHYLMGMDDCLVNFYEEPDEMKALIEYISDWEVEYAKHLIDTYRPDALFHHDDWGSEKSTFISPHMFEDFFVEPYKKIYKYYHDHGVELVFHHGDSYAATLVPYMIEMGIDVWQGCMESNDVPALLEKYRGQIAFMGNIDNKDVDHDGWTQADARATVVRACPDRDTRSYIPCITQGGPGSVYPGAYDALTEEIDRRSEEVFGVKGAVEARLEMPNMFG